MDLHHLIEFFDSIGIMAFAATGALVAGQRKMDIFGGFVLAMVTGIGGGTMRDLILDVPVFWTIDNRPLWACVAGFGVAILLLYKGQRVLPAQINKTIQWLDALGLALFTVIGAHKAMVLQPGLVIPVIMGVMTGIGGGLLRDVLANKIPLVLSRIRFYATASVLGALIFALIWPYQPETALVAGFAVTLVCRLGALIYNWRLPMFPKHKAEAE